MPMSDSKLLEATDLEVVFRIRSGEIHAVNSVSFSLEPGEILGVVGESGCGKSVTMMSMLGLLPSPPAEVRSGSVMFDGQDLLKVSEDELRQIRGGDIGFIFQDPMTSLNPVFTVGFQLRETLRRHLGISRQEARKRSLELLKLVGIPDAERRLKDYPHQFSGGMRQRVMIAIALACDPKLLIADEPTTALDVTIQAQILALVGELRERLGMAIIWITHDLGVVAGIAHRVIVMYAGQIVECATVDELFESPKHPYTRALLETVPAVRGKRMDKLRTIGGQTPILVNKPDCCSFHPRCQFARSRCATAAPSKETFPSGHYAVCFRASEMEAAINA